MGKEAGEVSQIAIAGQRGGKTLEMLQELKRKYAAVEMDNDQLRQQLAAEQDKSADLLQEYYAKDREVTKYLNKCVEINELARKHFSDAVEWREKAESAEATIAAMRSALEATKEIPKLIKAYEYEDEQTQEQADELTRKIFTRLREINAMREQALSNTAGAEYAERLKKLEAAAWAVVNARGSRINFNAAFNMQPIEIQNKINELEYQISAAIDNLQAVLGEGKA